MARKYVVSIDLNKNELLNARIQNLGSAPSSPVEGQIYYNNAAGVKTMYFYNGSEWIPTSGSVEVITDTIGQYVLGGTGLTAVYDDGAGTTTLNLDNTTVTAGAYGSQSAIPTFTVDEQGRLTAAGSVDVATNLTINGDTGTTDIALLSDELQVSGGEGIDVAVTTDTITISAEDATSSNKGVASFDATDFTVTAGAVTLNAERVEDIIGDGFILGGTGIDVTYNDGPGTLSVDIDSTVVTKDDAQTLTNKTLGTTTALGANLNAATYKITNLGAPTDGTDAATKAYVDAVSEGLHIHEAAKVYVGTNIDIATALEAGDSVDGVTLSAGMRVLVNGQTAQSENGIYVVQTSGAATRALDFDSPLEVKSGDFIFVSSGTVYANTGWVQTLPTVTIGSSPISFTQFSGAGTYTAGAGLTLNGTVFSVDVTPTSGSASLTNTGGAVEVKTNTSDGLEVTANGLGINNGTGLTFSSGALTFDTANGYGVRKLAFSIGDGTETSYTVNHALATRDVTVQIFDNASPFAQIEADVEHTDSNNLTIRFAVAPTSNQYRVVVVG
jgi:hypothetical protein